MITILLRIKCDACGVSQEYEEHRYAESGVNVPGPYVKQGWTKYLQWTFCPEERIMIKPDGYEVLPRDD